MDKHPAVRWECAQLSEPVASAARHQIPIHRMVFCSSDARLLAPVYPSTRRCIQRHVCSSRHSIPCWHAGLRIACLTPARGWVITTATLLAIWSAGRVSLPITRIYCAVSLLSALHLFLLHVVMLSVGKVS